ncbi:hypothetical protein ACGFX4_38425 [Kitasatospora sp. NPDC048365]|uniref:hypothetical protein n=1 Tax=Kitasatospora sp. NPDC048365 TaxID=3364050 RepID=UPI00371DB67E
MRRPLQPRRIPCSCAWRSPTTSPPPRRPPAGLGAPTDTWVIQNSDLLVEGWENQPGLYAVRRPNRALLGWVAQDTGGWATYVQGRQVIDATDRQPWLSKDAPRAVSLLRAALDKLA